MFNKMAKSGGAGGGHGSVSNLSSARQNSFYVNSKGSFRKVGQEGANSSRKIDYQNLDFGYKNKETPNPATARAPAPAHPWSGMTHVPASQKLPLPSMH